MVIGVVGAIAPVIPGPPIVWLGALYYAWRTGFDEVGVAMLAVLGLLAIVGGTSDWWMGYLGARRGGASGWATLASFVGGIAGLVVFSLPGMLIGSIGGVVLVEYLRHRDWRRVARASGGYLAGWLLSAVIEVAVCLLMIALFFAAVYF
jgi:uncharacterized protein YqgC (DUF456 family)